MIFKEIDDKMILTGDVIKQSGVSEWEFNDDVASIFTRHISKSVPCYEMSQNLVLELSDWFVGGSTPIVYDIGCATGLTLVNLAKRHKQKDMLLVGLDTSNSMLEKAKNELSSVKDEIKSKVELFNEDCCLHYFRENISLVYCLYTLQFIEPYRRIDLLKNLYEKMHKRAGLVLIEKVIEDNPIFADVYKEVHINFKTSNYQGNEILNKALSLRGRLIPLTEQENLELVQSAGFITSTFFKFGNFLGILAVK